VASPGGRGRSRIGDRAEHGFAAHAGNPYLNVDRSNDMGNDTGISRVEGLNDQQRNANYRGPLELRAPTTNPPTAQTAPSYAPR
jgi:hypothetical protein